MMKMRRKIGGKKEEGHDNLSFSVTLTFSHDFANNCMYKETEKENSPAKE